MTKRTKHWYFVCFSIYRTECYDYLFDIAVQMKQSGIDVCLKPEDHELKYQKENNDS